MASEKRLIDANALIERIKKRLKNEMIIGWLCSIVDEAPTVDAVEVVRCKDCTEWDEKEQECKHWYGFRADNFCSYGERKTE